MAVLQNALWEYRFQVSYLEYFFVKWDGHFLEACFVFLIFHIILFSQVDIPVYTLFFNTFLMFGSCSAK